MEHITRISLYLNPVSNCELSQAQVNSFGPMLQSVLMENVYEPYVDKLHLPFFNPFSQYCFIDYDGSIVWQVNALNNEAAKFLIDPVSKIESFKLKNLNESFFVIKKTIETLEVDRLFDSLRNETKSAYCIRFVTPTAFKSKGEYVIIPDVRLIFQNLLMHYNQIYAGSNEIDNETINYIAAHTKVTSYNLRSRYFSRTANSSDKIPGFYGSLKIYVSGPQSLRGLVSLLLNFGEASGIGIKTSMGMGGMQLLHEKARYSHNKEEAIGR